MNLDHHAAPGIPAGAETAKDPVCGMTVAVKPDTRHAEFQGETFHFCSEKCLTKFEVDPWFYASGRAAGRKKAVPTKAQFTCPMHPEIIRDVPGASRFEVKERRHLGAGSYHLQMLNSDDPQVFDIEMVAPHLVVQTVDLCLRRAARKSERAEGCKINKRSLQLAAKQTPSLCPLDYCPAGTSRA